MSSYTSSSLWLVHSLTPLSSYFGTTQDFKLELFHHILSAEGRQEPDWGRISRDKPSASQLPSSETVHAWAYFIQVPQNLAEDLIKTLDCIKDHRLQHLWKKDWRFLMYTKHLVLPLISTPAPVCTPPRHPTTFLLRLRFAITNIEKCNVYVTELTKLLKPTHLVETQETEVFILPRSTGPTKVWDC